MAIPHAKPGEVVNVQPMGDRLAGAVTSTLVKTDALEVIRLVLPAGKQIAGHQVAGELTLQCLEGRTLVRTGDSQVELGAGHLIYLRGSQEHSLQAETDSSLLLTLLLAPAKT